MNKTMFYVVALICFFSGSMSIAWDDGDRALGVVAELSHDSGKLGTYRALIIGINDYEDTKIEDLKTAVNDAEAMAEVLHEKYGFKVRLMLGSQATRKGIYNALRNLAASAKPDESVLIYFAGHGDLDRQYNDGWWIPVDAQAGNPITYLDNVQVQKAMRNMKARHVLLVSDSCYSGTLFGEARAMPPVITDKYYLNLYNERSRWGITSGNREPVSDAGTGGHSVFAYQLLKELAKNEKPYVSTQEIYTRIAPIVGNNSEQTPLCRPILNTGDQGGEFVFVASRPADPLVTTLSVSANVNGAQVLVDGKEVGETPLSDVAVSPGEHKITVEKKGYESYGKRIRLESGRSMSLYVDMGPAKPPKGRLYVETQPEDATVRILNIGPRFTQGMELDPGRYHVEVSVGDYQKERMWVDLSAGEDKNISIRLDPVAVETPAVSEQAGRKLTNTLGMEFVYIPPGSFMMGSPLGESVIDDDYDRQHRVTFTEGFYLQTTEVTQGQWDRVMGNNPSHFKNCGSDCPVETVSWDDVQTFIRKLNQMEGIDKYRLPTEAEWEYSARAGTATTFSWGNNQDCSKANYGSGHSTECERTNPGRTMKTGSFPPNPWGLYDMSGNVWEWCQDWDDGYPSGSVTDPKGASLGVCRVVRGGSWNDYARFCRSAYRHGVEPDEGGNSLGFRLAKDI